MVYIIYILEIFFELVDYSKKYKCIIVDSLSSVSLAVQ
jgi:hypothetical protein